VDAAIAGTSSTGIETQINDASAVTLTKKRRIKLPEAPMPTFDGKYENWLSFKNAFHSMIGSQTDLSEIDKLHYLKSALTGDAANKIKIFTLDFNRWHKLYKGMGSVRTRI